MLERPAVTPGLTDGELVNVDVVLAHLRQWLSDTERTRDTIRQLRQKVEEASRQLENPKAAFEYLDFFDGFFSRAAEELGRISGELPNAFSQSQADALKQLASNAAAELRRTVVFRDKWVNKPLPFEAVRPMLSQMAGDLRDQLNDYREMRIAANVLVDLHAQPPRSTASPQPESLGRRELFSKLVRPLADPAEKK